MVLLLATFRFEARTPWHQVTKWGQQKISNLFDINICIFLQFFLSFFVFIFLFIFFSIWVELSFTVKHWQISTPGHLWIFLSTYLLYRADYINLIQIYTCTGLCLFRWYYRKAELYSLLYIISKSQHLKASLIHC